MKVLSDNQINSVVGAGFWSDVRDKFREHFSSDHSKSERKSKDKKEGVSVYDKGHVSVDIGGPSLAGGKGIGIGGRVTINW